MISAPLTLDPEPIDAGAGERAASPFVRATVMAWLAVLGLAACQTERLSPGLETTILPATIEYGCDEGRKLRVERAAEAVSARVTVGTRSWTLPRADSAAQEKSAEGATALYLDGDAALFESDGRVLAANCRSATPLPRAPTLRPYRF